MSTDIVRAYRDLSLEFIDKWLIPDLHSVIDKRPVVLIRIRVTDDRKTQKMYEYDCDIQQNLNTEDLVGICGIFEEIHDDIMACWNRQKQSGQAVVIVSVRESTEEISDDHSFVYLYDLSKLDPTR